MIVDYFEYQMSKALIMSIFYVAPTLGISLAFIIIGAINIGTSCDIITFGMSLPTYLIVYGSVDLFIAAVFTFSLVLVLMNKKYNNEVAIVGLVLSVVFFIVWIIISVCVSDNATSCSLDLTIFAAMMCVNLVLIILGFIILYIMDRTKALSG